MKWTVCIATTPLREELLHKLMTRLLPQVEKYEDVEILIFFNNYEYSLGFLRQSMIEEAHGEYVTHIDDDDMVPEDYVDSIYPLLDGIDYVGFKVRFIDNGLDMPTAYHSLKYRSWAQDSDGYYRNVTHLNPVRRELALEAGFPVEVNIGEDEQWAVKVNAKTEHFIDREMYTYNHVGDETVNRPSAHDAPKRPVFNSNNVRFHSRSTPDVKTHN